jgi:hypothetical protein
MQKAIIPDIMIWAIRIVFGSVMFSPRCQVERAERWVFHVTAPPLIKGLVPWVRVSD